MFFRLYSYLFLLLFDWNVLFIYEVNTNSNKTHNLLQLFYVKRDDEIGGMIHPYETRRNSITCEINHHIRPPFLLAISWANFLFNCWRNRSSSTWQSIDYRIPSLSLSLSYRKMSALTLQFVNELAESHFFLKLIIKWTKWSWKTRR